MSESKKYRTSVYVVETNGRATRKTIRANSKRELNEKREAIKKAAASGKNIFSKALFGEVAEKWLTDYKIPSGIKKGTIEMYKSAIMHLNQKFEKVEISKIRFYNFQEFIYELANFNPITGKPPAKRTLENIKKVAKSIFDYARANDVNNVPDYFKKIIIPKSSPVKKRKSLNEEEQQWIIDTPHRAQTPAMIMMFAGLRRGEVIPLQWSDIDLTNNLISVNKSVDLSDNQGNINVGGKTVNAERTVVIPKILVEYLKKLKNSSANPGELVCTNSSGKMHTKSSWRRMWDSYLNTLNIKYGLNGAIPKNYKYILPMKIEPFSPHCLRHTFATILYLQGIDVATAKELLGHADITTTMNIYTDMKTFNKATLSESYSQKLKTDYKISI